MEQAVVDNSVSSTTRATCLLLRNLAQESEAVLDDALAADPANPTAWHLRALSAASLSRHDEAILALKKALEYSSEPDWYRDLGAVYYGARDFRKALACFRTAWRLGGESTELLTYTAHALFDMGANGRALALYERASILQGSDPMLLRGRAMALLGMRRRAAAVELLKRACYLDPDNYACHEWLARAYVQLRQHDSALRHRLRALDLAPDPVAGRTGVFFALWLTGLIEECLALGKTLYTIDLCGPTVHLYYVSALDHFTPSAKESRDAWTTWSSIHCQRPASCYCKGLNRLPDRILRVGYLVDQIHHMPDWHFIPPLIENRNRIEFSTSCYLTASFAQDYPKRAARNAPRS